MKKVHVNFSGGGVNMLFAIIQKHKQIQYLS